MRQWQDSMPFYNLNNKDPVYKELRSQLIQMHYKTIKYIKIYELHSFLIMIKSDFKYFNSIHIHFLCVTFESFFHGKVALQSVSKTYKKCKLYLVQVIWILLNLKKDKTNKSGLQINLMWLVHVCVLNWSCFFAKYHLPHITALMTLIVNCRYLIYTLTDMV